MTCKLPIDYRTGDVLKGERFEEALKNPNSLRCNTSLNKDDIYCPSCGGLVADNAKLCEDVHFPFDDISDCSGRSFRTCKNEDEFNKKADEDKVTLSKEAYLELLTAEKGNKTVIVKNIDYAWSVISTVIGLVAAVWGWGAFNAYKDVEAKTPLLVVMAKAYGPTYNPITRHGYRMYIKHFTTMEGVEDNRKESDRYKDVVEETIYDLKNGLGL